MGRQSVEHDGAVYSRMVAEQDDDYVSSGDRAWASARRKADRLRGRRPRKPERKIKMAKDREMLRRKLSRLSYETAYCHKGRRTG